MWVFCDAHGEVHGKMCDACEEAHDACGRLRDARRRMMMTRRMMMVMKSEKQVFVIM